jgi:hypothetical protein
LTKWYKTFLATWRPAGGVVRVVLVDEPAGWRAFFCNDLLATVADVLETIADRFSLEISFRDCKVVVGAGVGAGPLGVCERWGIPRLPLDVHADRGVGLGAPGGHLVDRSDSHWDSPLRRPSHADRRRPWRRALRGAELRAALRPRVTEAENQAAVERLLRLAAKQE